MMLLGNNSIFIRHADDDADIRDKAFDLAALKSKFDLTDAKLSAPLSKKGQIQIMIIKTFFDDIGIKYDEVWSSPMLRTMQTALYLKEEKYVKSPDWLALNEINEEFPIEKQKLIELFYKKTNGKNRIIVGHGGFEKILGFKVSLKKSEFIVYNHEVGAPIYHGSILNIVNYY